MYFQMIRAVLFLTTIKKHKTTDVLRTGNKVVLPCPILFTIMHNALPPTITDHKQTRQLESR